jgi:hypothetical protein
MTSSFSFAMGEGVDSSSSPVMLLSCSGGAPWLQAVQGRASVARDVCCGRGQRTCET